MEFVIKYEQAVQEGQLEQILELQTNNHKSNLPEKVKTGQGFVTVKHDLELIKKMNIPYPHIIATNNEKVIGYTLVMLRSMENEIPILKPLFLKVNDLQLNSKYLRDSSYFVMGQVCIDYNYRGKGIFAGLYKKLGETMCEHFDYIITEIDSLNVRSCRAHEKVGFRVIHTYTDEKSIEWKIVLKDISEKKII